MIYIIIPVFNRITYTIACISSLHSQSIRDFKIIVIDHGSTDGTSEMIEKCFKDVILLKGDNTLWWAGATNIGVKEALKLSKHEGDLILSLNNDLVVNGNYLEELLKVYHINKPCLVGSVSVHFDEPEKIQFAGIKWNSVFAKFKQPAIVKKSYSLMVNEIDILESDLLTGRGTLIPKSAFIRLGLYDEKRFPHYAADEDFSLNCKINGYKLLVSVKAIVKSHVEDTGLNFQYKKLNFFLFLKTLSSIKSANNLSIRYKWAMKNARFPYLYFSIDVLRILGSYCRSLLKKQ